MGVYIKGITIEMLKNASLEAVENLLSSGDMAEVEEPHGRLIDADELVEIAEKIEEDGATLCIDKSEDLETFLDDEAPTVIESEG